MVKIDTAIVGENEIIEFSLRGTNGVAVSYVDKSVKVYIGCHSPTTMTGTVDIPPDHDFFKSSSEDGESVKFLVYPTVQNPQSMSL